MNIVDILIGFVGGGAVGGGALYALQQGKISEALQKYEKIRAALGQTEAELKDTKGQLKLLDVSEERIRNLEATYREEVAKLQKDLEDSQARLQEAAIATPDPTLEVTYKNQIQELQQEYEAKIEELRQTYQGQIQEILEGKQTEIEALRQSQQAQLLELENGYQSQIQQLEQGYQSQLLELQNAPQPVVAELPIPEDYQTTQIVEPWDDFPDSPKMEIAETPAEIFGIAGEGFIAEPEFAPELETMVDFGGIDESLEPEFAPEMGAFEGFTALEDSLEPEFAPEMEMVAGFGVEEESLEPEFMGETSAFGSFETMVEMPVSEPEFAPEMNPFDGFVTEETLGSEAEFAPDAAAFGSFETMVEMPVSEPEFAPEMNSFDGFVTEETLGSEAEFAPEMEMFAGFETLEGNLEAEPEFAPAMEETFVSPEMTMVEDFPVEEQAISNLDISATEMEFLNGMQLEEETRTISSLEELSGNYDEIFTKEAGSNDTGFFDLLPTDAEKFADAQNSLDDLFADTADTSTSDLFDPFGEETAKVESNGKNGSSVFSNQEELDFFSMLDDAETGNLELPSDEELPLDDLFSDDLFSDWDNSKTTKLESH
jgi:hypothetical protein